MAARFLLRAVGFYALIYVLWLPLRSSYVWLLTRLAETILRVVERPPLITSLTSEGNVITLYSFVTGPSEAMASWNGEDIHLYVVVTLALVLAVPARRGASRLKLFGLAAGVIGVVSTAICVVQLKTVLETHASSYLDITMHTACERIFLEWANRALIMVGMFLFPASLFFGSYLALRSVPPAKTSTRTGARATRTLRPSSKWIVATLALGVIGGTWLLLGTGRLQAGADAFDESWKKIARLNPGHAAAALNVGRHHEEAGRMVEAVEWYRRSLATDPGFVDAHYNLANVLLSQQQYEPAADGYRSILSRAPDHGAAHRNLGIALLKLRRPCQALTHFSESVRLDSALSPDPELRETIVRLQSVCPGT